MLNKRQIEQLARNSSIKGIRYYMQRVHEDVDILSGEEKRLIIEETKRILTAFTVAGSVPEDAEENKGGADGKAKAAPD